MATCFFFRNRPLGKSPHRSCRTFRTKYICDRRLLIFQSIPTNLGASLGVLLRARQGRSVFTLVWSFGGGFLWISCSVVLYDRRRRHLPPGSRGAASARLGFLRQMPGRRHADPAMSRPACGSVRQSRESPVHHHGLSPLAGPLHLQRPHPRVSRGPTSGEHAEGTRVELFEEKSILVFPECLEASE